MKKIVFLLLIALCLPIGLMAQSYDDDLYFIPSKEKEEEPAPARRNRFGERPRRIFIRLPEPLL
jgi:hypothetical protein